MRLTDAELARARALIEEGYAQLAVELYGADAVPEEVLEQLVRRGLLTPAQAAAAGRGIIGDAYLLGQAIAADGVAAGQRSPYAELRGEYATMGAAAFRGHRPDVEAGLNDWERAAAAAARRAGGALIVGLGNKVAADFTTLAVASDNAEAQRWRRVIAETVAQGIEARDGWRRIRGSLGEALGEDWARDLHRIAATETQAAVNEGQAHYIEKHYGREAGVAAIPNPEACESCRRFYLDGGKPRIFRVGELPDRSVNFKKKQSEWVATVPPLHPWCHCQIRLVPPGWWFDDDWQLWPPSKRPQTEGEPQAPAAPEDGDDGAPEEQLSLALRKGGASPSTPATGRSSTCVLVRLPEDLARRWPTATPGLDEVPPHVTVGWIGRLDAGEIATLRRVVEAVAAEAPPFLVRLAGLGHFAARDAAIAHVEARAPELARLRARVLAEATAAGVPVAPQEYDYRPHATLAYLPTNARWRGPTPTGAGMVRSVEVWAPDGVSVHPLGAAA